MGLSLVQGQARHRHTALRLPVALLALETVLWGCSCRMCTTTVTAMRNRTASPWFLLLTKLHVRFMRQQEQEAEAVQAVEVDRARQPLKYSRLEGGRCLLVAAA